MSTPQRRPVIGGNLSQDASAERALPRLRDWGRYLDENHDLVVGILDELVKNTIGSGIVTIPKPLNSKGEIDEAFAEKITKRWNKWARTPDVTGELSWNEVQRMIGRAWFRDGEQFLQHVTDGYPFVRGETPYRLELLESDLVPFDLNIEDRGWRQGVQMNAWRKPSNYAVYKQHPGDVGLLSMRVAPSLQDVKIVPAANMTHVKFVRRWPATRGISILHSVISRLYDIKDLEESERIKNRILASWTAAISKSPDVPGWNPHDSGGDRYLAMAGGTIIDSLAPGESITGVGPEYPNPELNEYIADQIRRMASGTGTRYSSISKRYDGNYAAQRQEMVESEGFNTIRTDSFVSKVCRVVYERWLLIDVMTGGLALPPGMDTDSAFNAEYRGPVTPWIDPLKETQADALAVEKGFISQSQVQIKRGASPEMIGKTPEELGTAPKAPAQLELIPGGKDDDEEDAA